jgi:hypothetical protein
LRLYQEFFGAKNREGVVIVNTAPGPKIISSWGRKGWEGKERIFPVSCR